MAGATSFAGQGSHTRSATGDEVESVCDIAELFYAVSYGEPGYEASVLDSLNPLDDFLNTIESVPRLPNGAILDGLVARLTVGESVDVAVAALGGMHTVLEPIFGSLGRVFARSNFEA